MSELFYPHGGGAELATYLFAKLLVERDFNVTVLTNQFNGEPNVTRTQKMVVYRLPLFKGTGSVKYSILRRLDVLFSSFIRKMINWADVVYVPRFWYSAIPLAKAYKKPVVVHLHDYIPICPLSNFFDVGKINICDGKRLICSCKCIYSYEKLNYRSSLNVAESMLVNSTFGRFFGRIIGLSDAVVCVSNAQRELLLRNGAFLPSETYVIYNPLPDITENDFHAYGDDFGYFGGPSYLKGFHVLCKAAAFARRFKPVTIHATKFYNVKNRSAFFENLGIITYGKLDSMGLKAIYGRIKAVVVPS
ncbi:MAG: glycosyltransferase, partial [Candidatus Bathyarchaeia archaeon]